MPATKGLGRMAVACGISAWRQLGLLADDKITDVLTLHDASDTSLCDPYTMHASR